jgi:hypothetical protein
MKAKPLMGPWRELRCWRGHVVGSVSFKDKGQAILYLDPSKAAPPGSSGAAPAKFSGWTCVRCGADIAWHRGRKKKRSGQHAAERSL